MAIAEESVGRPHAHVCLVWMLAVLLLPAASGRSSTAVEQEVCGSHGGDDPQEFDACQTVLLQVGIEVTGRPTMLHKGAQQQEQVVSFIQDQLGFEEGMLLELAGIVSAGSYPGIAFLGALGGAVGVVLIVSVAFTLLQRHLPHVYSYNEIVGRTSLETAKHPLGWLTSSYACKLDDFKEIAGLDAMMQIEFYNLGLQILAIVSIPTLFLLCPMHLVVAAWHSGRRNAFADLSLVNVRHAHWINMSMIIVWLDALVLIFICLVTVHLVYRVHHRFIRLRYVWLSEMSPPRSTTLMVEGIPRRYRTDAALKEFFATAFPQLLVLKAYVVKRTDPLPDLVSQSNVAFHCLQRAEQDWANAGTTPEARPKLTSFLGSYDSIDFYKDRKAALDQQITEERERILREARDPESNVCSSCGFVTFGSVRDMELAYKATMSSDIDAFVLSYPPEPQDIVYSSLEDGTTAAQLYRYIGYALIAMLIIISVSIVGVLSAFTDLACLRKSVSMQPLLQSQNRLARGAIEGLACSWLMTILIIAIASCMSLIFRTTFRIKSHSWAQRLLHTCYSGVIFGLVLVVLPVHAAGWRQAEQIADWPGSAAAPFVQALPGVAFWFMCFLATQCAEHAMALLRVVPLIRFLLYRQTFGEELARQFSEPESQDQFGRGVRSSRASLELAIGLVFCIVFPPITIMCMFDLVLRRGVDGYLMYFSESKKADLGGAFWVTQVNYLFAALLLLGIFMTSVLHEWSCPRDFEHSWVPELARTIPTIAGAVCSGYVALAWLNFNLRHASESLPIMTETGGLKTLPQSSLAKAHDAETHLARMSATWEASMGTILHGGPVVEEMDVGYAQNELLGPQRFD